MGFMRKLRIRAALKHELQRRSVHLVIANNPGEPRSYALVNRETEGGPIHPSQPDTTRVVINKVNNPSASGYFIFDPPPFKVPQIGPFSDEALAALVYLTMLDHAAEGGPDFPGVDRAVCDQIGFSREELFGL